MLIMVEAYQSLPMTNSAIKTLRIAIVASAIALVWHTPESQARWGTQATANSYKFSDDTRLRTYLQQNGLETNLTLDEFRDGWCAKILKLNYARWDNYPGPTTVRSVNWCKERFEPLKKTDEDRYWRLVIGIPDYLIPENERLKTAAAGVGPSEEVRKKCLQAQDFMGCVRAFGGSTANNSQGPRPNKCGIKGDQNYCIAGTGKDLLGWPKFTGWRIKEKPGEMTVHYTPPWVFQRVKVRGVYGRYFEQPTLIRYYDEGDPGTPDRTLSSFAEDRTECKESPSFNSGGTNFTCTTTAKPPLVIQGRPARTAGVKQYMKRIIFDCDEMKYQVYNDGKTQPGSKWRDMWNKDPYLCEHVSVFPDSEFTDLEGGTPVQADLRWVQ